MDTPPSCSTDGRLLPMDLSHHFSDLSNRRSPSFLNDLYKLFEVPGMRNIAGGFPNPLLFPFDTLEAQAAYPGRWISPPDDPAGPVDAASSHHSRGAQHIVIPRFADNSSPTERIDLSTALQYGMPPGIPALLAWVRHFALKNLHPSIPYHGGPEVVLTSGSTDGFAKVAQIFISPWNDKKDDIRDRPAILAEAFTYPAVLSEAVPRGAQTILIKTDNSGMLAWGPGGLEDVLSNWDYEQGRRPHLMYTIAQANNPAGYVVPIPRKRDIYAVCKKYDVIIVEDEPYWHLQFPSAAADEAESRGLPAPPPTPPPPKPPVSSGYPFLDSIVPSFLSMDTDGRVIRLDTFSKTIAPGCRLGWITAQPDIIEQYIRATETATQQPSGFTQSLVARFLLGPPPSPPATPPSPPRFPFSLLPYPFSRPTPPPNPPPPPPSPTTGYITWLTGLHTIYHRRMLTMCRILDAGSHLPPSFTTSSSDDWTTITPSPATPLLTFRWPRGGMFVWLRVALEKHPLISVVTGGPRLSRALYVFLTDAPFRVAASRGSMFAATAAADAEGDGWAWFRLCFAAETEENVEAASRAFVEGVHAFWGLGAEEVEGLLGRDSEGMVEGLGGML